MPAPIKTTPDFELVNAENPEGEPWLAASPDGRFSLLFYETIAGPPIRTDLEERIYRTDGSNPESFGTTFSSGTNEHQPASTYLPDGRRVYVWTEEPTAGGGNEEDVYAEIRYGNGIVDVARFLVTGGAGRQVDPIVAANSSGFAIAVVDDSVANGQLILKFYNTAGALINTVTAPNAPESVGLASSDQYRDVEIVALANGSYVTAWSSGANANIFARVYSSSGIAQSGVIDVQTSAPNAAFPEVAALADGRFVATYLEFNSGLVVGRMYSSDGTPDGAAFTIGTGAANAVSQQAQTAALQDGRFVTVWQTATGDIAGQVTFADGNPDGATFTVNTITADDQSRPTIATLADGRFAVSWESGSGSAKTIYTTIFDPRETGISASATGLADDWIGTSFADTVFLGNGNDSFSGGLGNDTVRGEAGNDSLRGEAGNDSLYGGANNDTLDGGADNDNLFGGLGADSHIGDSGIDYARYDDGAYGNITVSLNSAANAIIGTGAAAGDSFSGVEGLIMGAGNDWVYGDTLNNLILSGDGNDNIFGSLGADFLDGGTGFDYARFDDASYGALQADLAGANSNTGAALGDTYANIEGLILTGFGDMGFGNSLDNYLYGLGGNDTLDGRSGADNIDGGIGNDSMIGGTGNDVFWYRGAGFGRDTVQDFAGGTGLVDQINLQGVFANFAAVIAASVQVGANLEIRVNGTDVLVLQNFSISNFAADDVIL